jgi:hypothetical protein
MDMEVVSSWGRFGRGTLTELNVTNIEFACSIIAALQYFSLECMFRVLFENFRIPSARPLGHGEGYYVQSPEGTSLVYMIPCFTSFIWYTPSYISMTPRFLVYKALIVSVVRLCIPSLEGHPTGVDESATKHHHHARQRKHHTFPSAAASSGLSCTPRYPPF